MPAMERLGEAGKCACAYRRPLGVAVVPVLLVPLMLLLPGQLGKCCYMVALMAVFWLTEVIPIAATGFIPVFLAPIFGLLTSAQLAGNYMKDVTMMTVGGLIVAVAIEKSQLHKRIAFLVLRVIGTSVHWLMLGFMLPTFLCSMFISNAATVAMMLPILEAVLSQLDNAPQIQDSEIKSPVVKDMPLVTSENISSPRNVEIDMTEVSNGERQNQSAQLLAHEESRRQDRTSAQPTPQPRQGGHFRSTAKKLTLAVVYASHAGGTATLTGTPANLILKGHADQIWEEHGLSESPITYSSWMTLSLPLAVVNLLIIYAWLSLNLTGCRSTRSKKTQNGQNNNLRRIIKEEYRNLGPLRFEEIMVTVLLVSLVFLWFFRNPGFVAGWSSLFPAEHIKDSVPAMLISMALFCIPTTAPWTWRLHPDVPVRPLLTWTDVKHGVPWSLPFLMGGGFTMAQCAQVSGLSEWIGESVSVFSGLPYWLMLLIMCLIVSLLTEITTNSATCTVLMPIVSAMAEKLGLNPLRLMLPVGLTTSLAFMLPVASVANAIAFSFGRLAVIDMVKGGAVLNCVCVVTVVLVTSTWGSYVIGTEGLPWSNNTAATIVPFIRNATAHFPN